MSYNDSYNRNFRYAVSQASHTQKENDLFSPESISLIQRIIAINTKGIDKEGRNIIVPEKTIRSVCDSFYENTVAQTDVLQMMIANFITNAIIEEHEQQEQNNKLSVWITKYDIDSGMRQVPAIKLNNKRRPYTSYFSY